MSFLRIYVKCNHKIKFKLFLKFKFKSQILSSLLKVRWFFSNKYKKIQVFNSYMTIKGHNEYFKSKFSYFKLFKKKINDHYDVIKASFIFMIGLKIVWKEGQNCSYSNRYISGTNWNFCMWFSAVWSEIMPLKLLWINRYINLCHLNFKEANL